MQMTRELKKRFMEIADRLEKIEKKKKVNGKTNGKPDVLCDFNARERLEIVEKVLVIPGPERKEGGRFLSGYAMIVDALFTDLKKRLEKVELRGAWTPNEAKTLDARVKNLWDRPSADSFKVFLTAIEDRVTKAEAAIEPLFNVGNWIDKTEERLKELEDVALPEQMVLGEPDRPETGTPLIEWVEKVQDRLQKLEQIPDPASDSNPTVFGRPLVEWITEAENRIGELERKPVAGPLSNIAQKMEQEIKDTTQSVKTLRRKVQRVTWLSLLLFAMIILTLFLV